MFTEKFYFDGKQILTDAGLMQGIQRVNSSGVSKAEIFELSSAWIKLRLDDSNFAIDTIKEAAQSSNFAECWVISEENQEGIVSAISMIDCEKIGFMGHSLGGATAFIL